MARRLLLSMLLAAGAVLPQELPDAEPHPEVFGVIAELGTDRGIPGVEVSLRSTSSPPEVIAKTTTDENGKFHLEPGQFGAFFIGLSKEGWSSQVGSPLRGGPNQGVTLTGAQPRRELKFWLAREAQLSGRVIDGDTEQPVAGRQLIAWRTIYQQGRAIPLPSGWASTAADGQFVFTKLPANDYLIALAPRALGQKRILTSFSPEDANRVDRDYEQTYWPGGMDLASAVPVHAGSGASIGVGDLRPRLRPLYRARVWLAASDCEKAVLSAGGLREEVPCGKPILLTGLERGRNRVTAVADSPEGTVRGAAEFDIRAENVDVAIQLSPGVDVDVRVIAAEGSTKPDLEKIHIGLRPIAASDFRIGMLSPDTDGRLRFRNVEVADQGINIFGLGPTYYVKEVRYNGALVPDRILPLATGALAHTVEIVLDDKPAVLSGSVTVKDDPLSQPRLYLIKWPLAGDLYNSLSTATGGDDGNFRFTSLAPGDYRVFAVRPENADALEVSATLMHLFEHSARQLTLTPAGFQRITLEPVDP